MNDKTKGEIFAKTIWILGALLFGLLAVNEFFSIGNPGESTRDCIVTGIGHTIYFLAFTMGNVYLFKTKKEKTIFIASIFYLIAFTFSFICQLTDGGKLATEDLTAQILSIIVYVIFVVFTWTFMKGETSKLFNKCLHLWYLPALLLFLIGVMESFWTEFTRPDGFLFDGLILDLFVSIILIIPIYTIMKVIKERISK